MSPWKHNGHQVAVNFGRMATEDWDQRKRKLIKRLAFQALGDIQEMAPVDTGLWRAASDLTINEQSSFDPPPNPNQAENEALAAQQLERAQARVNAIPKGTPTGTRVLITNNLRYSNVIEFGYGKRPALRVFGRAMDAARRNAHRFWARSTGQKLGAVLQEAFGEMGGGGI